MTIFPEDPSWHFIDKMGRFKKIRLLEDSLKNDKNVAG
jgi:hypothetical protein